MKSSPRVVSILGLPIANLNMARAVASIESRIRSGGRYQIATANLDFVQHARKNAELHRVICDCAMVLPDGFPLVWASRLLGRALTERVAGSDLTIELAKLSAERGYSIFLLGSTDQNAQQAMQVLSERYPGVRFVGQYAPPPAPLDQMNNDEILRRIHEAKPDILLVAFGNPKQEIWIHRQFRLLDVPISIGIGGTLEMIAGAKVRAPRYVQALNLEWLFRMLQEPGRLLPRYARDFGALLRYLPREILAQHLQWKDLGTGHVSVHKQDDCQIIQVRGAFTGNLCSQVRDAVTVAIRAGDHVTVSLSETSNVEADGLGCLVDARRSLKSAQRKLSIVGCSPSVEAVLTASSLKALFARHSGIYERVESPAPSI